MSIQTFQQILTREYTKLFADNADYVYAARTNTPEGLAKKMTESLWIGTGSKDGIAIKTACKELKIKHTYTAIKRYLATGETS